MAGDNDDKLVWRFASPHSSAAHPLADLRSKATLEFMITSVLLNPKFAMEGVAK